MSATTLSHETNRTMLPKKNVPTTAHTTTQNPNALRSFAGKWATIHSGGPYHTAASARLTPHRVEGATARRGQDSTPPRQTPSWNRGGPGGGPAASGRRRPHLRNSGGRIRTDDLRVMSPARCPDCAPPHRAGNLPHRLHQVERTLHDLQHPP